MKKSHALVLTGGGARGAYQAGSIWALSEICASMNLHWPFKIITGCSAGSINASYLAANVTKYDYVNGARDLKMLWENIRSENVYKTDLLSLTKNSLKWLNAFSLLDFVKNRNLSLLDNAPLRKLLDDYVDLEKMRVNMAEGVIDTCALSAISYGKTLSMTFFETNQDIKEWHRFKRVGVKSKLTVDHIMASSAIPIVFPPTAMNGDYLGDGSLRDYTPLSPAVHLGADSLFIIGVRRAVNPISKLEAPPSLGKILGFVLNSILLDALELDFERMQRINQTVKKIPEGSDTGLKSIQTFFQMPSQDLGAIAARHFDDLANPVQFLIKSLGDKEESADIISYILFESKYTSELVKLGYEDTFKNEKEIRAFLNE